jgi:hypothetical protein
LEYYQIQIADGDMKKKACSTWNGSYEFLMLPFKFGNVPSTFTTLVSTTFREEMDDFVIIYINNILSYSKMAEEHAPQLKVVLRMLRDNKLYANDEKYDFAQLEIEFLSHVVTGNRLKPDMKKMNSNLEVEAALTAKSIESIPWLDKLL